MEVTAKQTHDLLEKLIDEMDGPPKWSFAFVRKQGAPFFMIYVPSHDNYDYSAERTTSHEHPVPWAAYNAMTWKEWLYERCLLSMTHEMGEMVRWGDVRPFAPTHGPGDDPYRPRQYRDPIDALTTQRGMVRVEHGLQNVIEKRYLTPGVAERLRKQMWGDDV